MSNELLWLVVGLQLIMGASDTILHHEFTERLAWQPSARRELQLHAARNLIYALLFAGFAFGEPFGICASIAMAFILVEVLITLWDFVEEDLSRKLPATERVLHTLLALNYGAILALLMPVLYNNSLQPTAYAPVNYGLGSIALMGASIGVLFFGVRDYLAAKRASHLGRPDPAELAAKLRKHQHILITGATGFIGSRLTRALLANGHNITVLTRDPEKAAQLGTPIKIIQNLNEIEDHAAMDAIINLAGEPLATGLWTKAKREKIIQSRLTVLEEINTLCTRLYVPPKTIITASAIGWYGLRGDEKLDETSDAKPSFNQKPVFTHKVCRAVEDEADKLNQFGCRVVKLRIGLVLGTEGGMLANLLVPFEYGLGGPIGSGRQWMSWIDLDDVVRLIIHSLSTTKLDGPVNAVAPTPITNRAFAKALGKALHRPSALPLPAMPLRLALGDFAEELLLGGQRVQPDKAEQSGFKFRSPTIEAALQAAIPIKTDRPINENRQVRKGSSQKAHENIICENHHGPVN